MLGSCYIKLINEFRLFCFYLWRSKINFSGLKIPLTTVLHKVKLSIDQGREKILATRVIIIIKKRLLENGLISSIRRIIQHEYCNIVTGFDEELAITNYKDLAVTPINAKTQALWTLQVVSFDYIISQGHTMTSGHAANQILLMSLNKTLWLVNVIWHYIVVCLWFTFKVATSSIYWSWALPSLLFVTFFNFI